MRIPTLFLLFLIFPGIAHAAPSRVWWPQWTIQSGEELWDEVGRKYSSYPIPLMLDGDPKTAWVDSARQHDMQTFPSRYGFIFSPSTPVTLDALWIMNGQNRSLARFLKNHRVTKIRVTQELLNKKKIVTETKLSDAMGWHVVKLPRHKIKSLKIEFPEIKQSQSENADVCISELELRDGGKKIDWRMPRAVMFLDGTEGCGATLLISRSGKVLDGIAMDIGYDDQWNSSGRYVAGFAGGDNYVWIADTWQGKVIRKLNFPPIGDGPDNVDSEYSWANANTLMIKEYGKSQYRFLKAPNFR